MPTRGFLYKQCFVFMLEKVSEKNIFKLESFVVGGL